MAFSSETPVDHGYAWVVLLGCFLLRMFIEGFWSTLGVLFVRWEVYFDASVSDLSWIGSTFMLILLSSAPLASALAHKLTYRVVVIGAGIVTSTTLFAITMVTQLWHIYIIMPICGVGVGLAYQASCIFFAYYFDKRFVLATGLSFTGYGVGVFTFPPLMETLIVSYGWRGAMQIMSALMANISVCGALLRPPIIRTKEERDSKIKEKDLNWKSNHGKCITLWKDLSKSLDLSLFCNVRFIFQGNVNGFLYGWNYMVILYLVPYCIESGISPVKSTFLLSAIGISMTTVRLMPIGLLVDKNILPASKLAGVSTVVGGFAVLTIPFIQTYWCLILVSLVYGMTAIGIGGLMVTVLTVYSAGSAHRGTGAVAWMILQCGVGSLVSILVAGFLHDITGHYTAPYLAASGCLICKGLIMLADPWFIRFQYRLDTRKKDMSGNIIYSENNLKDTVSV